MSKEEYPEIEAEIRQIIINVLAEKFGSKPDRVKWYVFDLSRAVAKYVYEQLEEIENITIVRKLDENGHE